jgi:hypothetical protein
MKILILGTDLTFDCVPRLYPLAENDLRLYLRDELKNIVLEPSITFIVSERLSITLESEPIEFKAQAKYEIELKIADVIIYRGKMIILESGTNIQNYTNGSQSTNRFKYNE